MSNATKQSDPALVMVSLHQQQHSAGVNLWGSSIRHRNTLALSIRRAEVKRDLSTDWYFPTEEILEVELSPTQFADLLCSMNTSGVPATLRHDSKGYYAYPVMPTKAEQFREETEESLQDVLSSLKEAHAKAEEALSDDKPLGKKGKKELLDLIDSIEKLTEDKLPFILNQFSKQMSKTVSEAKGEVEAYVSHKIITTGIEELRKNKPELKLEDYSPKKDPQEIVYESQ